MGEGAPPPLSRRTVIGAAVALQLATLLGAWMLYGAATHGRFARELPLGPTVVAQQDLQWRGLAMVFYEGINFERPVRLKIAEGPLSLAISPAGLGRHMPTKSFSVNMGGRLVVPQGGEYEFEPVCSATACIRIDGEAILDTWPGHKSVAQAKTKLALTAGTHAFRASVSSPSDRFRFQVHWSGPGMKRRLLEGRDFLADPNPGPPPK